MLRETGWEGVDSIHVTQDRDLWWTCKPSSESSGSITCGELG